MTVVIGTSNLRDTRRTRSMRSHWEMRSGSVEIMISSKVCDRATRSIEATGSPLTTSPSAATPAARSHVSNALSRPRAVFSRYSSVSRSMTAMPPIAPPASTGTGAENGTTTTKSDYDWSYDAKSYSDDDVDIKTITDNDTTTKTDTDIDTDIKTITDTKTTTDSHNTSDSFNKTDTDFAVIDDVKDFGNLGVAGHDLTFDIGDDFSFTLNIDNILNGSLSGEGADSVFSTVQANHLADQDKAWNITMENGGAQNHLSANAGTANGADGMDMDSKGWDLKAGDDVTGTSTADASAILANSGFHMELVQGANMLSNAVDSSVIGGNSHASDVGEDTSGH